MDGLISLPQDNLMIATTVADLEAEFERGLPDSSLLAFRVAFSVLRQREDAEDVAQEALSRAYRKFRSLRNPERLRSWLVRVSFRLALDQRRSQIRRQRREQAAAPVPRPPDAGQEAAALEFRDRLRKAIEDLPEKLKLVVLLAPIQGHDLSEVARLTKLPEGTVKSRLFLARKRLAEKLL
jgi:RNA polymerase sigma-70 factor (ECF subfamily)